MGKKHKQFVTEISKEFEQDYRVVNTVIGDPLLFTAGVFRDVNDLRPVRHRYWGVFSLRNGQIKT